MVAARPLAPVRTVLLTGASGFLGHLLCLAWMERMARVGGRVLALVRAVDAAAAAARLREAFADHPPLALRFAALAPDHLVALPGDLAAPGLGLPAGGYDRLAAEVDLIVHAGALVNHAYRYEQLFAPNVQGTAQLVRLALRDRRKRFDFVSSLGVLAGARDPGRTLETEGVEALHPVWPAEGGYAHGYAASKWAGELLLRELHARFRAPVRVFRCGLILPHRHARGQFNAPDLLSRLLTSVLATGLAPHSFYAAGGHPHFDGLPVDFVAAALVALSSADRTGGATYQVSNPHRRDRVSLDTFMDWVASAGYSLERIADHATWLSAFRDRLQALPAPLRQRSALPILELWAHPIPAGPEARVDGRRFGRAVALRRPGGEPGIPTWTRRTCTATWPTWPPGPGSARSAQPAPQRRQRRQPMACRVVPVICPRRVGMVPPGPGSSGRNFRSSRAPSAFRSASTCARAAGSSSSGCSVHTRTCSAPGPWAMPSRVSPRRVKDSPSSTRRISPGARPGAGSRSASSQICRGRSGAQGSGTS